MHTIRFELGKQTITTSLNRLDDISLLSNFTLQIMYTSTKQIARTMKSYMGKSIKILERAPVPLGPYRSTPAQLGFDLKEEKE